MLVGEGSSDLTLAPILERLALEAGAAAVRFRTPDLAALPRPVGKAVQSQVAAALQLFPDTNLLFVHRDADRVPGEQRERQVLRAACPLHAAVVAVVPVRELESWLLVDEAPLREAVGRPRGREPLGLPRLGRCEDVADPKQCLRRALDVAQSGVSRRRRVSFVGARRRLLERLDPSGPVRRLPSFHRLVEAIAARVADLQHE